jgi:hypothetical protein
MVNLKSSRLTFWLLLITASSVINLLLVNTLNANNIGDKVKQPKQTRTAQVIKMSNIFQQADNQSKVIETISEQEPVVVHRRQKAWYFVATKQKLTGWLSMLNVRFSGVAKRTGEFGVSSALSSLGKNALPTESTGIRGFDEADLQKAKANFEQLALVNTFQVSLNQAGEFAQQGQLKTNSTIEVK